MITSTVSGSKCLEENLVISADIVNNKLFSYDFLN